MSDEISRLVDRIKLIDPFDPIHLKPAGYKLTVGQDYALGGRKGRLLDKPGQNELTIPPFEVAILSTSEKIRMPGYLIGRWNLRVTWVYRGLLWVGGPQVDPGFFGHLFCPIYNLSSDSVTLRLGDEIALIDFVRTTRFKIGKSKWYGRPKRTSIYDYNIKLKSALFSRAGQRVDDLERELRKQKEETEELLQRFGSKLDLSIGTVFTSIAVVVTVLSILVITSNQQASVLFAPLWLYGLSALSFLTFFLSIFALSRTRRNKQKKETQSKHDDVS